MSLPALFQSRDITAIPFQKSSGVLRDDPRFGEPGDWWLGYENYERNACLPAIVQVLDHELTGSDPSTGTWRVTVTPLTTQNGVAAADGMASAYIEVVAAADTLDEVVLALIDEADESAELLTPGDVDAWIRFRSYVTLSVSPTDGDTLRLTSLQSGMTFSVVITFDGSSSSTETVIAAPATTTVKVGTYVAIDRDKGNNGFDELNQVYAVKAISSTTPIADIIGPVRRGVGTKDTLPGFAWREYEQGDMFPFVQYGSCLAYAEKAIAATNTELPIYIRHTTVGDYLTGMITDAAGAALGATANLWTGTPTAVDTTLYRFQITVTNNDGTVVTEEVAFTSGAGTTATLICNGLRTNLALKATLSGLITAGGTATLTLTGPADGRAVTVTSAGPGTLAFVETAPEVSTHIRFPRDKFAAASTRIGPVPVTVPMSNG